MSPVIGATLAPKTARKTKRPCVADLESSRSITTEKKSNSGLSPRPTGRAPASSCPRTTDLAATGNPPGLPVFACTREGGSPGAVEAVPEREAPLHRPHCLFPTSRARYKKGKFQSACTPNPTAQPVTRQRVITRPPGNHSIRQLSQHLETAIFDTRTFIWNRTYKPPSFLL